MRLSSRVPRPHLALFSLMLAVLSHAPSTEAAPGGKPVLQSGDACLKTSKGCDAIKAGATFATNEEIQVGEQAERAVGQPVAPQGPTSAVGLDLGWAR